MVDEAAQNLAAARRQIKSAAQQSNPKLPLAPRRMLLFGFLAPDEGPPMIGARPVGGHDVTPCVYAVLATG
ncbi:hypothetical protein [Hyphomicrobium sp. D-2]|uniref:hypothetical protein n=1 Tax=Hyphomicrobium sp. D-2 TaxID=3041621 RepID=UPI002457BF0D|nr:hypothetical protein [Hyphomicrobium sp. D-2]MDH4982235.1 hypothetical protein [Hyphomicrobium sp. D-2]